MKKRWSFFLFNQTTHTKIAIEWYLILIVFSRWLANIQDLLKSDKINRPPLSSLLLLKTVCELIMMKIIMIHMDQTNRIILFFFLEMNNEIMRESNDPFEMTCPRIGNKFSPIYIKKKNIKHAQNEKKQTIGKKWWG